MKTVVDKKGNMVELAVVANGEAIERYCLSEGYILVDYLNDTRIETNGVIHPPVKPRWDFVQAKWVDDATQNEIQGMYPPAPVAPLTADEQLRADVDYLAMMVEVEL
jgi:hypothetical protein